MLAPVTHFPVTNMTNRVCLLRNVLYVFFVLYCECVMGPGGIQQGTFTRPHDHTMYCFAFNFFLIIKKKKSA